MNKEELQHFGVLGMRWGVRKETPVMTSVRGKPVPKVKMVRGQPVPVVKRRSVLTFGNKKAPGISLVTKGELDYMNRLQKHAEKWENGTKNAAGEAKRNKEQFDLTMEKYPNFLKTSYKSAAAIPVTKKTLDYMDRLQRHAEKWKNGTRDAKEEAIRRKEEFALEMENYQN